MLNGHQLFPLQGEHPDAIAAHVTSRIRAKTVTLWHFICCTTYGKMFGRERTITIGFRTVKPITLIFRHWQSFLRVIFPFLILMPFVHDQTSRSILAISIISPSVALTRPSPFITVADRSAESTVSSTDPPSFAIDRYVLDCAIAPVAQFRNVKCFAIRSTCCTVLLLEHRTHLIR